MILEIILTIVFVIVFFIVIRWQISKNKTIQKIDVTPNSKFVINIVRSEYTDDYCLGRLSKTPKKNKNGTTLITYYPIDVEENDFESKMPQEQKLVVKTEHMKEINIGRRGFIFILSRNPLDYPKEIADTTLKDWADAETQKAHIEKVLGKKMIQAGDKAIEETTESFQRGHLSQMAIDKRVEEIEIAKRMAGGYEKKE